MSVITVTGNNDFERTLVVRRLIGDFVQTYSELALERLDGEDYEFARISEALTSVPFLVNKKMVLFQRPSANTDFVEAAERLLAGLPDSTELLLVEPKFDKRSRLYKLLKDTTDFREYNQLDGPALARWLTTRATELEATLSPADARYLVERVGINQQLLANELDKLVAHDKSISRRQIDALTERTPQSTIFELIEAAFAGKPQRALELYDEQRRLRVEPIQIIAMLAWQLHVLALVVSADGRSADAIASEAKLNPFTVRKSQPLARRLSLSRLRQLLDELVQLDRRSKRESIDLDEALRLFILRLA